MRCRRYEGSPSLGEGKYEDDVRVENETRDSASVSLLFVSA